MCEIKSKDAVKKFKDMTSQRHGVIKMLPTTVVKVKWLRQERFKNLKTPLTILNSISIERLSTSLYFILITAYKFLTKL